MYKSIRLIARLQLILIILLSAVNSVLSQRNLNSGIKVSVVPDSRVSVHFNNPLRTWDGFGVNYVEACQTRNYDLFSQDYSGFGFATTETREMILDLIFGEKGLRPALTKLFLDPFHEGMEKGANDNDDPLRINMDGFDHESTTKWMRYFNREGLSRVKKWGGKLTGIVTLYSPAPWMTRQKYILGRDLDPDEKEEVAEYLVSWAKYLIERENIPVKYLSLHNEGDAYYRWPRDGSNPGEDHRDYNMYWPPGQVADMIKITRKILNTNGLYNLHVTPGETQTWYRFDMWGYASTIANDSAALNALGLITSHSFANLEDLNSIYYGDYRSIGQDLIQALKTDLKVWVTSRPWSEGVLFIENLRKDIYESKANGIIPWAIISGAGQWLLEDGSYRDGSMNAAFIIKKDGSCVINDQYYYYKQVTMAGQPGMSVCLVTNLDPSLGIIGFSSNNPGHQDAFVIINKTGQSKKIEIIIEGGSNKSFRAFRTSDSEKYSSIGEFALPQNKIIVYEAPAASVTTFFGNR